MRETGANKHLALAFLVNFFNGFAIFNIAPVIPIITGMLKISIFWAGLFVSISLLGTAAGLLPGGILSDRVGVRKALICALLSAVPSLFLLAFFTDFLIILILRFILGLSCGFIFVGTANYAFVWSEESKVARNQGIFGGAFGFGIAAAYLLSLVTLGVGWIGISLTPLPVLLASIFALKTWGKEYVVGKSKFSFRDVESVITNRDIILLGISQFVLNGFFAVIATWITSYLTAKEHELIESIFLGAVLMSMMGFSRLAGGFTVKFLKEKNLISLSLLACAIAIIGLASSPVFPLAFALALVVIWFSQFSFGPANRLTVTTSRHLSGTSLGVILFIFVLGAATLPAAYGYILDFTRSFEVGFWLLASICWAVLAAFYTIFRVRTK